MAVATDDNSKFADYAHPERLVSTDWLAGQLNDGAVNTGNLVVLESDEDVLLYDTGHIPGAVKIDWHLDLNDAVTRDYVNGERFAQVLGGRGIGRDTTVVIYGDKSNWWAAYAMWVFTLFGHEDVRLLDGGRAKWVGEGREMTRDVPAQTAVHYPVVERDDAPIRAFKDAVLAHIGQPTVDVRSPGEFSGELLATPDYPPTGAMRAGHIPCARAGPWARRPHRDAPPRAPGPPERRNVNRATRGPFNLNPRPLAPPSARRAPAFRERVIGEQRATDHILGGHETPVTAVRAVA